MKHREFGRCLVLGRYINLKLLVVQVWLGEDAPPCFRGPPAPSDRTCAPQEEKKPNEDETDKDDKKENANNTVLEQSHRMAGALSTSDTPASRCNTCADPVKGIASAGDQKTCLFYRNNHLFNIYLFVELVKGEHIAVTRDDRTVAEKDAALSGAPATLAGKVTTLKPCHSFKPR